jgi:hypothetical protein
VSFWADYYDQNTNVVKLCEAVDLESSQKKQLVHYSSGIGTRMKEAVSDVLDMAVAWFAYLLYAPFSTEYPTPGVWIKISKKRTVG